MCWALCRQQKGGQLIIFHKSSLDKPHERIESIIAPTRSTLRLTSYSLLIFINLNTRNKTKQSKNILMSFHGNFYGENSRGAVVGWADDDSLNFKSKILHYETPTLGGYAKHSDRDWRKSRHVTVPNPHEPTPLPPRPNHAYKAQHFPTIHSLQTPATTWESINFTLDIARKISFSLAFAGGFG